MSDSSDEGEPFRLHDFSEETDDERPNKRRRMMRQAPLRAKGLGFVSAQSEEIDEDDGEDLDDERPSMGGGLGFGNFQTSFNIGEYNEGAPVRSPSPESESESQKANPSGRGPSAFTANGKIQKSSFAARMMAKMGHVEGKGLGKAGQGISAPIQAQLLQNRAGLGHGTEPETTKKPKRAKASQPSTPGASTSRLKGLPKKRYEVTAIESRGLHVPEAMKSIIVDATGAETKLVSSLSGFSTPTSDVAPASETAKASSRIKMQLQAYADAWDATKDQEARLESEEQQLKDAVDLHHSEGEKLQEMISTFEKASMDDSGQSREWDQIIARLQDAQDRFADYMEDLDLPEIASACLEAPLRRELVDWEPLSESGSTKLVSALQSIGAILEVAKAGELRHRKRTTPFESLLVMHWFPRLRSAMKDWSVYNPDPLTNLLELWQTIIPPWLLYKVLHEIVLPKLIEAVRRFPKMVESNYNSLTTTNGVGTSSSKNRRAPELHSWLFDWWSLLASDDLVLERFSELRTLVKSKVDSTVWPMWKPLLGSRKSTSAPTQKTISTSSLPLKPPSIAATAAMEDISLKDIVEEWCTENDLLIRSTGKADTYGRLLYRIQDAERRSKGILVYLQDDVVFGEEGEPYGLDDGLARRARGR